MLSMIRKIVAYVSTARGAKITVAAWLICLVVLSAFAPSAKEYEGNSTEGSVRENTPSEKAEKVLQTHFQSDDGLTALVVFHKDNPLKDEDLKQIATFSEWLQSGDKPDGIAGALPFHQLQQAVQQQMLSEDASTLLFQVVLENDVEPRDTHDVLGQLTSKWEGMGNDNLQMEITGPAGITADTITLFKNADLVLILATVGLIFIILIFIYRSPLLAITPLLIAGIVYGVIDRIIGLFGKWDVFTIEGQAMSIMLVLLFAVVTDYSLFIFSRYKEELHTYKNKYDAMGNAIYHVAEPIFFSGGTVTLAMLSLFATLFKPYHYFAPVFTIAVVFILIAGITLIPALFALLGPKAFWPAVPHVGKNNKEKKSFWTWVSHKVVQKPGAISIILALFLLVGVSNLFSISFSFNLLKSFPDDMSSRVGFEWLEEHYPPGELAPVTAVLEGGEQLELNETFFKNLQGLEQEIADEAGISMVKSMITTEMIEGSTPLPHGMVADTEKAVKFQFIFNENPYEKEAIDTLSGLIEKEEQLLIHHGFDPENISLHFAGQSANQLDVRALNMRDMIVLFTLVTVLLTIVIRFQTHSLLLSMTMMGTILLSYFATLGFSWAFFHYLFGYEAISYRIPLYTFVFMVALGIDYNIMLLSRIKEYAKANSWKQAVQKGVASTGGVISSAGLILAATFSVLMTQPIQELFLFGSIMSFGILLDTFLIRGFFLPSILILLHRSGFYRRI